MTLADNEVIDLFAVTKADSLSMGTTLIDTLGDTLVVKIGTHWQAG